MNDILQKSNDQTRLDKTSESRTTVFVISFRHLQCSELYFCVMVGKVCVGAKWPIRPELILVSVA